MSRRSAYCVPHGKSLVVLNDLKSKVGEKQKEKSIDISKSQGSATNAISSRKNVKNKARLLFSLEYAEEKEPTATKTGHAKNRTDYGDVDPPGLDCRPRFRNASVRSRHTAHATRECSNISFYNSTCGTIDFLDKYHCREQQHSQSSALHDCNE